MRVTIWDLDYYFSTNKKNCFNPDVMKIASYHKQLGDIINFVGREVDIRRPYDLYYIIKENHATPNPPIDFITNKKVRWWGKAFKSRINWSMDNVMLGCRPDYLLYPEQSTTIERAEHIRLFNNKAELLPIIQEFDNAFKRKKLIVTDTHMWFASKKDLMVALKRLSEYKNIVFLEPIWLQKLIYDEELKELFLNLKLSNGLALKTFPIEVKDIEAAKDFILKIKKRFNTQIDALVVDFSKRGDSHWVSRDNAINDFNVLSEWIVQFKKERIALSIKLPKTRLEFPYFHLFELLQEWMSNKKTAVKSWLEFVTNVCGNLYDSLDYENYWNHPETWSETFRDVIRQTWTKKDFLLLKWGNNTQSEITINWKLWEEEFKYGI